jgi:membrane-bound lytic murein transglycosylase D
MPGETRHYVPKLQALKNIFSNPALMASLGLPEVINRPYFATVQAPRPMDIKAAARLAGMPVDQFVALNPAHNRPVMKAETPVVVPAEKAAAFQDKLERHDAPLTEWEVYTARSGERIEQVAQRFGIPLADLLRANGLQGKLRLSAGSTLLVPAGRNPEETRALSNEAHVAPVVEAEAPSRPAAVAKAADKPAKGARAVAPAKAEPRKAEAKVALKGVPAAKPAKTTVAAKAAPTPTKVARSGIGRRS